MKNSLTTRLGTPRKFRTFESSPFPARTMNRLFITLCALLLPLVGQAQSSLAERTIPSSHLYGVDVSTGFQVTLRQGSTSKAEIQIDSRLEPYLRVEVKNGILHLGLHNVPQELQRQVMRSQTVRTADITLNALHHLYASSGAEIIGEGSFTAEQSTLELHSGASVEGIEIEAHSVSLSVQSGASATLSGKAQSLSVSSSSGASANVADLSAVQVHAKASSGSGIRCWPTESLNAEASSGASIRFKGGVLHNSRLHSSSGGSIRGL